MTGGFLSNLRSIIDLKVAGVPPKKGQLKKLTFFDRRVQYEKSKRASSIITLTLTLIKKREGTWDRNVLWRYENIDAFLIVQYHGREY